MSVIQDNTILVLMATVTDESKETEMKKQKTKIEYVKPIIVVYSREGKDFWCD